MKQAFIAVIVELWEFVFKRTVVIPERPSTISAIRKTEGVPSPESKSLLSPLAMAKGIHVPVLKRPVVVFDTQIRVICFPEQVKILQTEGDYTHVLVGDSNGWIESALLESDYKRIQPHLVAGTVYTPHHEETLKLRRLLHDECLGGVLQLPLQATEFMLWRLQTITTQINWGMVRPRLPGAWQTILKGKPGVHIGIEPKTNAAVEYFTDGTNGRLGFVAAVHPDQSILVQSVGQHNEGEYFEETLSANIWREWRPVFISFT